jgi:hypothetical protein
MVSGRKLIAAYLLFAQALIAAYLLFAQALIAARAASPTGGD